MKIVNNSKKVLFTLQPLYNELTNQKEYTYFYDFRKNLKNYNFLVMKDKFKKEELDDSEFYTWFNLPWDGHMSLKGGTIYAREITKEILKDAFSIKIKDFPLTSFEKDRFKNYKKHLELYKGNKINIGNKEYYLDDLVNIRTKITKEYLLGKRFEFKLYGIDNILGKKLYYTDYPSYKLMDMHAVPFDIGVNSRKGLLQMHCLKNSKYKPKISNPDCFHSYIVMLGSYK